MFKKIINYIDNLFFGKPDILNRVQKEITQNQHQLLEAQNYLEWSQQQVVLYQKRLQRLKDQKNELEKSTDTSLANLRSGINTY